MLPKLWRLDRGSLLQVKKQGRRHKYSYFTLVVSSPPVVSQDHPRFGVVVSSQFHKRAIVRNQVKREIYSCVRDIKTPLNIIIIPYTQIRTLSHEEVCTLLHQAISQLSVI